MHDDIQQWLDEVTAYLLQRKPQEQRQVLRTLEERITHDYEQKIGRSNEERMELEAQLSTFKEVPGARPGEILTKENSLNTRLS